MKLSYMVVVGLPFLLLPSLASAEILSVKGTSANFREKPTETAKIKFSADKFYPVEIIDKKNGWAHVRDFEGEEAYVAERLLAKQASVVISSDKANIREAPNTASDVLFKAEKGEVFKIEERKEHWLKVVDSRGDGGWIRDDMTWGEAILDEVKTTVAGKGEKAEKSDKKGGDKESSSKAKEASEKLPVDVEVNDEGTTVKVGGTKVPEVADPAQLEQLCRVYLDEVKQTKAPAKAEKKAPAKPKPTAKPTKKAPQKKK